MISPRAMTVQQLLVTHPDYDADYLAQLAAFYEGGIAFEAIKPNVLRKRMQDNNKNYREARLACFDYTAPMGGKIDDLAGGILREPPRFVVNDNNDSRAEYWNDLTHNADGNGKDIAAVTWEALVEEMLSTRSYFLIRTPAIDALEGETVASAKERGRLDCTVVAVSASEVDHWDDEGRWMRTHCSETPWDGFLPPTKEIHRWTYFEADGVTIYTAERKVEIQNGKLTPIAWDDNHPTTVNQAAHGLGRIPLVPIEVPAGFNLGGRLMPICKSLCNREAALEFALDMGALNLPVLVTDKPVDQVALSEVGVLNVGLGGDFKWSAPSGEVFKALSDDCKRLLEALESALQAMAEKASASNDRTSGVAQQQFRAPKEVLMNLYAMGAIDALQIVTDTIAAYRSEQSLEPSIEGLDDFDTQGTELAIQNTNTFVLIPQMPLTAKKLALKSVIASFLPDIDEDNQKKIDGEIDDIEDLPPVPTGPGNTGNSGPTVNVKTGMPQGSGADQIRQKAIQR